MRWARIELNGTPTHGVVEGAEIGTVAGTPFGDCGRTGEGVAPGSAKLLIPFKPETFCAAGLNYAGHIAERAAPGVDAGGWVRAITRKKEELPGGRARFSETVPNGNRPGAIPCRPERTNADRSGRKSNRDAHQSCAGSCLPAHAHAAAHPRG